MKQTNVLIALGSNKRQLHNISVAKRMVMSLLDAACATHIAWTKPVGITSDLFVNMLIAGTTFLPHSSLVKRCKEIEKSLGDTHEAHAQGVVNIDVDVMQYGGQRVHAKDWNRPYIKSLIADLPQGVLDYTNQHI